jgi:tRNA (adenine37-N6)-methyltransferase
MEFTVRPVAFVRSTRADARDDDWDAEHGEIELHDDVPDEALVGLDSFSHVVVVYVFHGAQDVPDVPFARHPRGNPAWPRVGIFAQRAKDRPNRLGVSTCRILEVGARSLRVAGLDAIDGTPVLDLKPHVAEFGARGETRQPAWMDELMANYYAS